MFYHEGLAEVDLAMAMTSERPKRPMIRVLVNNRMLPDPALDESWARIYVLDQLKDYLLGQAVLLQCSRSLPQPVGKGKRKALFLPVPYLPGKCIPHGFKQQGLVAFRVELQVGG